MVRKAKEAVLPYTAASREPHWPHHSLLHHTLVDKYNVSLHLFGLPSPFCFLLSLPFVSLSFPVGLPSLSFLCQGPWWMLVCVLDPNPVPTEAPVPRASSFLLCISQGQRPSTPSSYRLFDSLPFIRHKIQARPSGGSPETDPSGSVWVQVCVYTHTRGIFTILGQSCSFFWLQYEMCQF